MKLKEIRLRAGLTQEQLAERINTTQCCISRWENGKDRPNIEIVRQLASVLRCTTDELLGVEAAG